MKYQWIRVALLAGIATLLAACGGGSSSELSGIQGTGFSQGTITGFGSIFVNGVEFDTAGASITVNGESGGRQDDLKVGYVVKVRGSIDANGQTGHADSVDYQNEVKGPISAVDPAGTSFVVMGQTIVVDGTTSLDNGLPPLPVSTAWLTLVVEVSGFRDASGAIRATRVELTAASNGSYEVKGTALAPVTATSFMLGTLTVTYSGSPAVTAGDVVEVRGTLTGTTLAATRVEIEDGESDGRNGDELEIEGLVTRFVSLADFDVNGRAVTTTGSTTFPDGMTGITLNAHVEVEGQLDANQVLVADKVKLEGENDARITARVTAVNAAANTADVFGVSAHTGVDTRFEDQSDLEQSPFNLSHLNVGDWVEVRGTAIAGPALQAKLLERDDLPSNLRVELRGEPTAVDAAQVQFTLLGINISAGPGTECEEAASCMELLQNLPAGAVLKVRGDEANGIAGVSLVADSIEVEEEDN